MGINWGNVAEGAGAGGAVGGPVGAVGGGLAGAFGWDPSKQFGNPGQTNFQADPYQTDPNAYRGGWENKNSAYNPNNLAEQAAAAAGAQAPGFADAQAGLGGLAGLLQGQAFGTAPSLAMEQLRQAQGQNAANTMALQATTRGLNPAQAALNAAQINSQGNQQAAAQGVGAALQERNAAQGMLGNVYQAQGSMGLQQQGQNNAMVQYFISQGMSAQQAQLQAQIAEQQINSQNYNAAQGLNAGIAQGNAQNSANLIGGLFSGAGALGGSALAGMGAAQGGMVPGYAGGGMVGGGLEQLPLGIVSALRADGGVIPGADPGPVDTVTDGRIGLRPGEVVVNQENPIYPAAKAAVQGGAQPAAGGGLMDAIARAFGVGATPKDPRHTRPRGEKAVGGGTGG